MYVTMDIMGNGVYEKNVVTVSANHIESLNQWLVFYANDGYLIQLRNVDKPAPRVHTEY